MIKKILKAVLPATYRKIGKSEQKILDALIEQNSLLRAEISKLNGRIDSLENTLFQKIQDESNWKRADIVNDMRPLLTEVKQTVENESNWKRADIVNDIQPLLAEVKQPVENESNWKRADIVNDMRPLLAEIKQTVENESNWKRHDIQKAMEESQYRIKNIEKLLSDDFYKNQKKQNETKTDFEKRMLTYLPKSICSYMHEKNMYMEEVAHVLLWNHSEIPFDDLDYTWRYLLENSNSSKWELFEHYTRFLFQHGDLLDNLETTYKSKLSDFEKWTPICQLSYVSFLFYKGHQDEAVEILKKYIAKNGELNLDYFIPVAYLAKEFCKIKNPDVILSAKRFETMKKNEGIFEKFINSGSLALVGNGPQEKGKSSGEKIDAHNTVLRFNGYSLSKEFHSDYGKKVTIWANCGNIQEDKSEKGNFTYFMYLPGIYDEPISNRFLDDFENAFTIDTLSLRKRIYKKTGLYCTSNGFNLIFAIKELKNDFSVEDCFGFSFKDAVISDRWMHYDGREVQTFHSLNLESNAIISLFNKQNDLLNIEGEESK